MPRVPFLIQNRHRSSRGNGRPRRRPGLEISDQGAEVMSKSKDKESKKESKKTPTKSLKEKRAEKQAKREGKS